MADCGSIMAHVQTLQAQIQSDTDQLNDPHLCDGLSKQECVQLREQLSNDRDTAQAELDQVLSQMPPICSLLVGTWQVDANGSDGQLTIHTVDSVTGQGLSGSMTVGGGSLDTIEGSWDDAAKIIQFTLGRGNPVTQDYTGFLGDNSAIILAGWFTQSNVLAGPGRYRFGWFARK